jgi:hypothetical protein
MDSDTEELVCHFCDKQFSRPGSFLAHTCPRKKRYAERNNREVQIGYNAYLQFYALTQPRSKPKTIDTFIRSPFYLSFVKFGWYCIGIKAMHPAKFVDYALKQNIKLDLWSTDSVYNQYLINYLRSEPVSEALTRSVEFSIKWANDIHKISHDCLRESSTNAIVHAIVTGQVSPWVIYNCNSGQMLLTKLDSTQVATVWPYIDADFWQIKFKDRPDDLLYAKRILQEAGW